MMEIGYAVTTELWFTGIVYALAKDLFLTWRTMSKQGNGS